MMMMLLKKIIISAAVIAAPVTAIWPVPIHSSTGSKVLFIDQTIQVTYNNEAVTYTTGFVPPSTPTFNSKDIVEGGISRTLDAIFNQGFVPWMLNKRGADFEPTPGTNNTKIKSLQITQTGKDDANTFKPKIGTVDESYSLNVTLAGHATIEAKTSTGVLYALETFSQLFFAHSCGTAWYTQQAPVTISDAPTFPHRGLLLDVSRHWFATSDIKRTIDGLAMNKMNMLHLHITDTQSWPLEIPALPLLAEKGAYHKSLTYSPQDVADLQSYGVQRGVQVVLEIDMPGHVGVGEAYPDVGVAYNAHPWELYCAQPPCGSFSLGSNETEGFIDTLFEDLLPRLSPYSAYFHTGGDEYQANNSLLDPALKTNDISVLQPLLQKFIDHVHGKVRELGLTPMVWEEMVLDWNVTLGKDAIVQTWLGNGAIQKLADAGHKVIDSSNDFYYLDCGRGDWLDYENGADFQMGYPFLDWCDPTKNWRLMYSHSPTDGLTEAAAKNVLGGEVCLWAETVDTTSLDSLLWPRAGAAAEIWWSGRTDAKGSNRSMIDARPRLAEQRERMLARGVKGTPITQLWCNQNPTEDCLNGLV